MPSVKVSGTTEFKDYHFTVKGRNDLGTGFPLTTGPHQFNFNKAEFTGDVTVATVDNYNGTGEEWTVATVTGTAEMTVISNPREWSVFLVGGGGGGGGCGPYYSCGGNGGAGLNSDTFDKGFEIDVYKLQRGGGGNRACDGHPGGTGGNGGPSFVQNVDTAEKLYNADGGRGGVGGPGPPTGGSGQSFPNHTYKSDVAGAGEKTYGGNGGPGDCRGAGHCATSGSVGTVIIAYRTG